LMEGDRALASRGRRERGEIAGTGEIETGEGRIARRSPLARLDLPSPVYLSPLPSFAPLD